MPRREIVSMEYFVSKGRVPETWKEDIIELGKKGKNRTHFINYLDMCRYTFYKLMERDPELKKVVDRALEYSEQWWVDKAIDAWDTGTSNKINAQFFKYYMSNIYRDNWKVNVDITTNGENINNQPEKIKIEIVKGTLQNGENL